MPRATVSPRLVSTRADHFATLPPDHPELARARESLRQGTCPLCGRTRLRNPVAHITRSHGFSRFDARDLFGAKTTDRLCPEELSAIRREVTARHEIWNNVSPRARDTTPRLTRAGALNRRKRRGTGKHLSFKSGKYEAYGTRINGTVKYLGRFKTELAAAYAVHIHYLGDQL